MHNAPFPAKLLPRQKGFRIDDDFHPAGVVIQATDTGPKLEHQNAGLYRNAQFHFQGEVQPSGSGNLLFVHKHDAQIAQAGSL